MDKLLTELLSPFAGRLVATFSAISIAFWATGLMVVRLAHPRLVSNTCLGRDDLCGLWTRQWSQAMMPAAAILIGVIILSTIVLALAPATLTFLHGGWWWRRLGTWRQRAARNKHKNRAQKGDRHRCGRYPQGVPSTTVKPSLRDRWRRLSRKGKPEKQKKPPPGRTFHAIDVPLQPTRLGNVFAAAQQRIVAKHGFRMNSCRRLLVEVMSQEKRAELEALIGSVMRRVHTMNWFLLATVWAVFLPGAYWMLWVAACLSMAHWMYREVCQAACEYCDALEAVVTVHRKQLYHAVGFPLPKSTEDELRRGGELSGYLDRGTEVPCILFQWQADSGTTAGALEGRPKPAAPDIAGR